MCLALTRHRTTRRAKAPPLTIAVLDTRTLAQGAMRMKRMQKRPSAVRLAAFFGPKAVVASAVLVIGAYAAAFWLLGSSPNGISSSAYASGPSLWQALYFSAITFTTVGYGDWTPRGWSMLLASSEALAGLALFGMLVANLASVRSSHLLSRLYSGDAQRRLSELGSSIDRTNSSLRGALDSSDDRWSEAVEKEMGALWAIVRGVQKYLQFENERLDFFGEVPINSAKKLLWKVEEATELGTRLLTVARYDGKPESVFAQRLAGWADDCVAIADIVDAYSMNDELRRTATTVRSAALRIRSGLELAVDPQRSSCSAT